MSPEDATTASATTAAMSAEGTSRRCGIAAELLNPLNNKQPIKPPGHRITRQLVPSRQGLGRPVAHHGAFQHRFHLALPRLT